MTTTRPALDRTHDLDINGSRQRIRVRATREGLPPLLVVQGGPGLPLLSEVRKFQRLLDLERDFLVAYWEQRGCGNAARREAERVSLSQQVADLRTVLHWLFEQTRQRAIVFAVSMGGTSALQAAAHEGDCVRAIVAISPDSNTAMADAAADAFIRTEGARHPRTKQRAMALPTPPYIDVAPFQQRIRLFGDLGAIEHDRTFNALLRETLASLLRTYGPVGAVRALRNMTRIQRAMMPEINRLDLFANPPRIAVPVHYVFGARDPLNPPALVKALPAAIGAPETTVTVVPDGGHMVHFDHADLVRSIVASA